MQSAPNTAAQKLSGGAIGRQCGAEHSAAFASSAPGAQYDMLLQDLRQSAALIASREVIVSMLADHEFVDRHGARSMQERVSQMNIVDGIFDSQVDSRPTHHFARALKVRAPQVIHSMSP